jgi:hypothetical protein
MEIAEIVDAFASSWNEHNETKRLALLEKSWADDGVYHDPEGTMESREALSAFIGEFHAGYPGRTIDPTSGIESNGIWVRWAWEMRHGDEVESDGMDFAEFGADGRIRRLEGFFGPLPGLGD